MSKFLVENFNNDRQYQLKQQLSTVATVADVSEIIYDELTFYADIEGKYINSLTPSQAKVALALLAMLRQSNNTLGDTISLKSTNLQEHFPKKRASQQKSINNTVVTIAGAGLGAAIGIFEGPIAVIIGAAMGGGAAKMIYEFVRDESATKDKIQQPNKIELELDFDKLIFELTNLFKRIDDLVLGQITSDKPKYKKDTLKLSDFRDLVEFIQKMLGRRYQGLSDSLDFALQEELPSLLNNYGLRIDELSAEELSEVKATNNDIHKSYEIITGKSVTSPVVELPAIFENERILLKGKIRIPNQ